MNGRFRERLVYFKRASTNDIPIHLLGFATKCFEYFEEVRGFIIVQDEV